MLFPLTLRADQPRYRNVFTSANGEFELKLEKDGEWILRSTKSNQEIYRLTGKFLDSMTILISDDGKSVVAIDDYSDQNYENNPDILIFYRNGKKIKSYKLDEIIGTPKVLRVSASHFTWTLEYEDAFSIKDSKLNLTTYNLNNYIFDTKNGEILKKEKDKILSDNAVYAFGEIESLGEDKYALQADCVIYGNAEKGSRILFDSPKIKFQSDGLRQTIIIKDGKLVARKEVFLNLCN